MKYVNKILEFLNEKDDFVFKTGKLYKTFFELKAFSESSEEQITTINPNEIFMFMEIENFTYDNRIKILFKDKFLYLVIGKTDKLKDVFVEALS